MAVIVVEYLSTGWSQCFRGHCRLVGGVNLANRLSETFAVMNAPGLKMLMSMGKNIAQQTVMEWCIRRNDTLSGKSPDAGCVAKHSEAELRGNRKIAAPYRGAVYWLILIPISASPGL